MSITNFKIFAGLLQKPIKAAAIAKAALILSALFPSATLLELAAPLQRNSKLMTSSAAIAAEPDPGSSLDAARQIALSSTTSTFTDSISNSDLKDYYKFTLQESSTINLSLTSQSGEADTELRDSKGEIVQDSEYMDTKGEPVNLVLATGTYYVVIGHISDEFGRPTDDQGKTDYELKVSATPVGGSAGNTLSNPQNLGSLSEQPKAVSDFVGDPNPDDYYRFELGTDSVIKLSLSGLSQNADVSLLRDGNNNGKVDESSEGQPLYSSFKLGTEADSLELSLTAGSYFIWVHQPYSFNGIPVSPYGGTTVSSNGISVSTPAGTRVSGNNTNYDLAVSLNYPVPYDQAGNSLTTARNLGTLDGTQTFSDFVGNIDNNDYYLFYVEPSHNLSIQLDGLSADASLVLLYGPGHTIDGHSIPAGQVRDRSVKPGTEPEKISYDTRNNPLAEGSYYILVSPPGNSGSNTNYNLKVTSEEVDLAGNSPSTAYNLGNSLKSSLTDFIGRDNPADTEDYYRYEVPASDWARSFELRLKSSNADVQLLDSQGNVVVAGVGSAENPAIKAISRELNPGIYYLRVYQGGGHTKARYALNVISSVINPSAQLAKIRGGTKYFRVNGIAYAGFSYDPNTREVGVLASKHILRPQIESVPEQKLHYTDYNRQTLKDFKLEGINVSARQIIVSGRYRYHKLEKKPWGGLYTVYDNAANVTVGLNLEVKKNREIVGRTFIREVDADWAGGIYGYVQSIFDALVGSVFKITSDRFIRLTDLVTAITPLVANLSLQDQLKITKPLTKVNEWNSKSLVYLNRVDYDSEGIWFKFKIEESKLRELLPELKTQLSQYESWQ